MYKFDLKTGMIVEDREKKRFLVLRDTRLYNDDDEARHILVNIKDGCNHLLSYFDIDLTFKNGNTRYDIVKVYQPSYMGNIFRKNVLGDSEITKNMELLWERKEVKELTMEELEEILGHPVKIKK